MYEGLKVTFGQMNQSESLTFSSHVDKNVEKVPILMFSWNRFYASTKQPSKNHLNPWAARANCQPGVRKNISKARVFFQVLEEKNMIGWIYKKKKTQSLMNVFTKDSEALQRWKLHYHLRKSCNFLCSKWNGKTVVFPPSNMRKI